MAISKRDPLLNKSSCTYLGKSVDDLGLRGKFLIISASNYDYGKTNPIYFKNNLEILGDITYTVLDFDDFVAEKVTLAEMCNYIEKFGMSAFINLSDHEIGYDYFELDHKLEDLAFNNGDFSVINLKDGCELRFKDGYTIGFGSYDDNNLRKNKYFDLDFNVSEDYASADSECFTLDNFYFTPSKTKFIINAGIFEYISNYNCRPDELPDTYYGTLRIVYDMISHKFTKIEVKDWRGNKINSKVKYKYKG